MNGGNPLRPDSRSPWPGASGTMAALEELAEAVAARAAEIALADLEEREQQAPPASSSPYLAGWQAAAGYLALSVSTLKHAAGVPRRKVGRAVVFRRDELDAWADAHFEGSRRFQNGSRGPGGGSESGIAAGRKRP